MAELSENDINNIISRVADAINNSNLSTKSDNTNQLLRELKAQSIRTVRAIRQSTKSAFSIADEVSKGSAKDQAQEKNSDKEKLTRDKKSGRKSYTIKFNNRLNTFTGPVYLPWGFMIFKKK